MARGTGGRTLRLIGYWAGPGQEQWPAPALFVDHTVPPAVRRRASDYLRAGTAFVACRGFSPCRICGVPNGCLEFTDGEHFVWPQGLAHYVEDHSVWLPEEVVAVVDQPVAPVDPRAFARDVQAGRVVIDYDWWRSARGSPS